jgi:multidrug resistance efflux pump
MRQQPRPESGGNETQEADFNVDLALRDGKFLAFLDKTPDIDSLDPNESGYAERIRAHFEIFKGAEELKREIVKTLKDKIKSESGVSLSDADFEAVQSEIEREAIIDPEVLKEKLEVLKRVRQVTGMRDPAQEEPTPEELQAQEAEAQAQAEAQQYQQQIAEANLRKLNAEAALKEAEAQVERLTAREKAVTVSMPLVQDSIVAGAADDLLTHLNT